MIIKKPENLATRVRYVWKWKYATENKIFYCERFKEDQVFLYEFNTINSQSELIWLTYRLTHVNSGEIVEYRKSSDPDRLIKQERIQK